MAVKKGAAVQRLDAAVEAVVDDDLRERRERAQARQPGQRRKAERDRARNRAMFDLPAELEDLIDQAARELSVPRSQVATWLMARGAENTTLDEMEEARMPSRSMRYEFVLALPTIPRSLKTKWK